MSLKSSDIASSSPPYAGEDVNSLLTFADMVLELDHTYHVNDDNAQMVLDAECILQKEKDHTYAVSKRNARNKVPTPLSTSPSGLVSHFKQSDPLTARRSSSEENITKLHGLSVSCDENLSHGYASRKSQSFERMGPFTRVNKEVPPNFHYSAPSSEMGSCLKTEGSDSLSSPWQRKDHTYAKAEDGKLLSSVISNSADKGNELRVHSSGPNQRRDAAKLLSQDHTYDKLLGGSLPLTPPSAPPGSDYMEADRQSTQRDHCYYFVEGRRQSAPASGHRSRTQSTSSVKASDKGDTDKAALAERVPMSIDHTYSTLS